MRTTNFSLIYIFLIVSILTGCATKPTLVQDITPMTVEQRTAKLLDKKQWQLRGKIAFIEKTVTGKSKRESASIYWQVNDEQQTQELNLNSYLGINVLHLESNHGQHLLKVDGKEYQTQNLSNLLQSLTGITLPIEALSFWLKGLPFSESDTIKWHPETQLPISLSSNYNNSLWQVEYDKYQYVKGLPMATKFTIEKDNLLIKVSIQTWSLDE